MKTALVPYSPGAMFDLVNDIESYPTFLPWCRSTQVWERSDDVVRASIELARSGVHKTFTTVNRLQKNKMIEMKMVDGPFHQLEGFWRFSDLDGKGARVALDLEFEISSRILRLTLGPVFHQIANTLVHAFCVRAGEVYGKS